MKVTVQEVIDALSDLSLAVLELSMPQDDGFKLDYRTMRTRYKDLAERIRAHGIAPPDGMVLVPNWETEFYAEREKFKNETLRASKLHALVQKFVTQHGEGYHTGKLGSNGCGICALVEEAKAMLTAAKDKL